MRKSTFLLLLLLLSIQNRAQQLVEFSLGSGYQYDIYYSLTEGITAFPERDNWEIAFATGDNPNIRINSGTGVTLFQVSDNFDDWDAIQSLPSNAVQLRNSYTDWDTGAFLRNSGWGSYNVDSQMVEGSKIYIINYGSYSQKIRINSLLNGVFSFSVANLDGSNEQNISLDVSGFSNKQFLYYSLINDEVVDREPEDWDIIFTKYEEDLNSNAENPLYYIVTGGLTNNNNIAQYDGFLDVNPEFSSLNLANDINTIGYDWKEYNGSYIIVPNRAYFLLNQEEDNLYKITFQSFAGGQTGNMSFLIEQLNYNPSSLDESDITFNIYPNPNSGNFIINYMGNDAKLEITDLNGRSLIQKKGSFLTVDINNLNNGIYIATIITNDDIFAKQIVVKK